MLSGEKAANLIGLIGSHRLYSKPARFQRNLGEKARTAIEDSSSQVQTRER